MLKKVNGFLDFIIHIKSGKPKAVKIYKMVRNIIEKVLVIFISITMLIIAFAFKEISFSTRLIAIIIPVLILIFEFNIKGIIQKRKKSEDKWQ